ncbi:response regulator [bacterium]|nr:response regulator [bacterium]
MMEFNTIHISIVADAAWSMKVVQRLVACGVLQSHITLIRPDAWPDVIRRDSGLCFWQIPDSVEDANFYPDERQSPILLGSCLNVRIEDKSPSNSSPYVLEWSEFDSDVIHAKLKLLIEEACVRQNFRMQEQWYRLAVAEANVGLWWWDRHLNFVYLSEHFQQMLGLSPDQLPSNVDQWLERIHEEDRDTLSGTIDIHFSRDAERFQTECRIRHADGRYQWYTLSGHLRSDDHSRSMILGSAVDVTKKKEAEIELAQANKRAQSANQAKNEFLTNMSHNLRTPLNAILGHTDLLRDISTEPMALESIDSISRNGQELMQLLDDILELSSIETVHPAAHLEKTSIRELLQGISQSFQPHAISKQLTLNVRIDPGVPQQVFADSARTRQVLSRIIENAIKFTPEGEVALDASFHRFPVPTLQLIVRDTGIGIPASRMETIFEPFCQADNSTSRRHQGCGLGLSICRRVVEVLGGTLEIESEVGQGTSVIIRLPVEVPALTTTSLPSQLTQSARKPLPNLDGYQVLLVEDGHDNQVVLTTFLKKAGAEVTLAENGQEAVDWIFNRRREMEAAGNKPDSGVDVVLMDMQMPVMDGYHASRLLREYHFAKPIIALTAHALKGDRERCLESGCDDYFTKPINRANLLEIVQKYAQHARHEAISNCV